MSLPDLNLFLLNNRKVHNLVDHNLVNLAVFLYICIRI